MHLPSNNAGFLYLNVCSKHSGGCNAQHHRCPPGLSVGCKALRPAIISKRDSPNSVAESVEFVASCAPSQASFSSSLSRRLTATKAISEHSFRPSLAPFSHLHATRCFRLSPQHYKHTSSTLFAGRQIIYSALWAIRQPFAENIANIATPSGLRLNEYGGHIQAGV
jgi:hypothetical protein